MTHIYPAVAGATIFVNAGAAIGDFVKARFVVKNAAQVGVPASWIPILGALKAAGVAGLLLSVLGVPIIGTAASAGLTAFFIGALTAHVRAGVFYNIAFPGVYLALAATSLVLSIR